MGRRACAFLAVGLMSVGGCSGTGSEHDAADARGASDVRSAANNTPAENKELARALIRTSYPQWTDGTQLECLDRLWFKESGWNHRAVNKRTGACGIPQSYPCKKMAAWGDRYGVDHRRNPYPQIAWGLQYIDKRYGSPCAAWSRFQRVGGY
mgnify:FL=1